MAYLLLSVVFFGVFLGWFSAENTHAQGSLLELQGTQAVSDELAGNRRNPTRDSKDSGKDSEEQPEGKEAGQPAANSSSSLVAQAKATKLPALSLLKLLGMALIVLLWVRAGDWVNQDSQIFKLGWFKWNHILYAPFAATALGLFFVQMSAHIRLVVMLVIFLSTWAPYVVVHNKNVLPHQTVLNRRLVATHTGRCFGLDWYQNQLRPIGGLRKGSQR